MRRALAERCVRGQAAPAFRDGRNLRVAALTAAIGCRYAGSKESQMAKRAGWVSGVGLLAVLGVATARLATASDDHPGAIVAQADGSLLVATEVFAGGGSLASALVLLRFRPDGTLDPTFGDAGRTTTRATRQ